MATEYASTESVLPITSDTVLDILPTMANQPEGRKFALLLKGLELPRDGAGYVVEILDDTEMELLAYIDAYGRAFETTMPETIPPARYARVSISRYSDTTDNSGGIYVIDEKGEPHPVAEYTYAEHDHRMAYTLQNASVNTEGARTCSYAFFMAQVYALFYHFPKVAGYSIDEINIRDVYKALETYDLLEAVSHIVDTVDEYAQRPHSRIPAIVQWLVMLLQETGLVHKTNADLRLSPDAETPNFHLIRLREHADTFYIIMDTELISLENEYRLMALEGVLNRFSIMVEWVQSQDAHTAITLQDIIALDADITLNVASRLMPTGTIQETNFEEFDSRLCYAQACENLPLPYRVEQEFRINATDGYAAITAASVSASSLLQGFLDDEGTWHLLDDRGQQIRCGEYLTNVAVLLAETLFHSAGSVHTLYITMLYDIPNRDACPALSVKFTREKFLALIHETPLAQPWNIISHFEHNGTNTILDPQEVEPLKSLHDPLFCPPERFKPITDGIASFPLNREAQDELHVRDLQKLNIFEEAQRVVLANRVCDALDLGIDKACEELRDIHDQSENLAIRSVCQQIIQGFNNYELDEMSFLEIKEAFKDIYGLQSLFMAYSSQPEANIEQRRAYLNEIITRAQDQYHFTDTDTCVYRCFSSYASRVLYAHLFDDGRTVLPMPDEVFAAHSLLALSYYDSFEAGEKGLAHAQECIRLAPTNPDGHRHAARLYFMMGDFASEIKECQEMLRICVQKSDLALAYYWMAFAYWKTGKPILGAICYRRSMAIDPLYRQESAAELEELLQENPHIIPMSYTEENNELKRAGVPTEDAFGNALFLVTAARIFANAGQFKIAQSVLAPAIGLLSDDALYAVIQSMDD